LNQKDDITILTGPNGYGKTTILNIVYNLFTEQQERFSYFSKLPFVSITASFSDDWSMKIIQGVQADITPFAPIRDNSRMEIELCNNGKNAGAFVCDLYANPIGILPNSTDITTQFEKILNSHPICFIKDQRLIQSIIPKRDGTFKHDGSIKADGKPVAIETIKVYARDLCNKISEIQTDEQKLAQSLDATKTKRFKDYKVALPKNEYQERFQKVLYKYKQLQMYDIREDNLETTEYEGDEQRFFSLDLEDWEKRIAVYDDLLSKLNLFIELLNKKELTNKKIGINGKEGFYFVSADYAHQLKLTDLSSGEQNEIIMLYDLLFKAAPGTLVLIDEPETSMHVAWQLEFINDLQRIAILNPLSFLIATHSPDLINDKESIDLWSLAHGEQDE
jgi:ABC-type lipoprotein export system ATPase subunit